MKRAIANPTVFNNHGFSWPSVLVALTARSRPYPMGRR
jgi:hypothetical protein